MNVRNLTLVTGATGLVGNNVVRLLRQRQEAVRVLIRNESDPRAWAGLEVETIAGDVRDAESVRRALLGVTAVIHCAAHVRLGWTGKDTFQAINVAGTRHVAEACRLAGARMVHISSTDVFGGCSLTVPATEDSPPGPGPQIPYVLSKRAAEQVVADEVARGLDAVVVNPGFMFGPWDWKPSSGKMLLAAADGSVILAPRGWISLCDVRDVAAGILAARDCGRAGRRYITAGPTWELIDVFRLIADVCGVRRPLFRLGPLMLKIGGWGGDFLARVRGREPDVNSAAVAVAWLKKNYSSARAQAELGYQIRPAEETVRDTWSWFQEHGYAS